MALLDRLGELHPRKFFLETWREIQADSRREAEGDVPERGRPVGKGRKAVVHGDFSWRPLIIFAAAAVFLTLMEYYGGYNTFQKYFPSAAHDPRLAELHRLAFWAGARITGYGILPALLVLLLPGERLADYGLRVRGFTRHLWIYGVLYLLVLPLIVFVSFTHDFQTYYPFLKHGRQSAWAWRYLLIWELLYAGQFVALEFFFRGFLLQSLRRQLGVYAIFAAVVPYCMIHFGKPFLEANAAIVAGVVLGTLALRTRSIWCGCLVHISVAVSMDVAALLQRGDLPTRW